MALKFCSVAIPKILHIEMEIFSWNDKLGTSRSPSMLHPKKHQQSTKILQV